MPKRGSSTDPARRNFLKGATIAGAAEPSPPGPQLAAYLRSLPGSKPVKDFPLLSQ